MTTADMPMHSNQKGQQKNFIAWFPKPNNEGENARVRLLWFLSSEKNNRSDPYFSQTIHDHWGETDKHLKIVDDVIVCPSTKYMKYDQEKWVKNEKTEKNELNCPICAKDREAMAIWKNSGWKDKLAMKRHFALQPKFRGIFPVYVINDPNNPKNKGPKVMILTNKEDYEKIDQIVKAEKVKAFEAAQDGHPYEIFNGKGGVDLYLHFETVEETKKNGFVQKVRKLTGVAFDDPSNKYDIPDICKEKLETFEMDEQFYIGTVTKKELECFYRKNYGKDEVVIPKENIDIFKKMKENNDVKPTEPVKVDNPNTVTEKSTAELMNVEDDINTLPFDDDCPTEDAPTETESSPLEEKPEDADELNDIMADIDNI